MERTEVKYKMGSLSAREIHTQNISSGWEHLHNTEKYILLSQIFTSFFFPLIICAHSSKRPFILVQFCLCFSKMYFSQEFCVFSFQAIKLHQHQSLPSLEHGSVVGPPVKKVQVNSMRNEVLLIIIMINLIIALCSRYSSSFQEYEDRFRNRFVPPRHSI